MTISYSVFQRTRNGKKARRWTILLTYPNGRRREITGYTDKRATDQKAAQLVRELERKEVGLHDPFARHRRRPLQEHQEAFLAALAAGALGRRRKGGRPTAAYVARQKARLTLLLGDIGVSRIDQLTAAAAEEAIERRRRGGWSDATRDHHVALARQFGAWLVDDGRTAANPFARLRAVRTEASRTYRRRPLTRAELQLLVEAAEVRPVAEYRLSNPTARPETLEAIRLRGAERGLLYLTAAYAGLRRGEACGLCWSDLALGSEPAVTVRAELSKNRRQQRVAVPTWLAGRLTSLRATRAVELGQPPAPTDRVFLHATYRHLLERAQADMVYAGLGHRDARGRVVDAAGLVLDLHSLRGTYASMLAELGAPAIVATELMRHSDVRMTFETYAKLQPGQVRGWVDQLRAPDAPTAPPAGDDAARRAR